ncbi:1-acyl-sn-glycerol-3-phosphate acyltransferase [Actinophytocola xinjiangensis]|uniref:1-acyl-sn-glycerol-3-phosphate acyltransferase n=1 Tax=Actinophytocola xinjiangensis TaxID=485602 RepID=A0A7Z0WS50_9PSEU|nr:lysophospholipid acyltransferase family protein [Actinophytocola xinjiangensis]OLF13857.1 1-acyl-sn-glycerol-3-phosphate acyltransferase [Actinophytocola xinjiangensis]
MLHQLVRYVLAPTARLVYRPRVHGLENVPADGPVILAANHRAVLDTAVISLVVRRRVQFLGKAEYFTAGGIRGRLMAAAMDGLGYIPVERGNAHAGLAALNAGQQVLNAGGAFAIYPEGTRSLDGRLYRGHTGVAVLAFSTGAPVVPVALTGTEKLMPRGGKIPRPARISVRFGQPLDFSAWTEHNLRARRAATDEVMAAIQALSQQEYVNSYHRRPDENIA